MNKVSVNEVLLEFSKVYEMHLGEKRKLSEIPAKVIIVKNHLFETNKSTDATVEYRYRINNSYKAMVLNYKLA